nr:hypothetical protein BaRGS_002720 [Batillaria attramentaria]
MKNEEQHVLPERAKVLELPAQGEMGTYFCKMLYGGESDTSDPVVKDNGAWSDVGPVTELALVEKPVVLLMTGQDYDPTNLVESTPYEPVCALDSLVPRLEATSYIWFENGNPINPEPMNLLDANSYTCQVVLRGEMSDMSDPLQIHIRLAAPHIAVAEPPNLNTSAVAKSARIVMQCQQGGDIEPTEWQWFLNGKFSSGSSLLIPSFNQENVGLYQCQAKASRSAWSDRSDDQVLLMKESSVGTACRDKKGCEFGMECLKNDTKDMSPNFCRRFTPGIVSYMEAPLEIPDHTSLIVLDCMSAGVPRGPTYTWYKDGAKLADKQAKQTLNVVPPFTGRYRCQFEADFFGRLVTFAKSPEFILKLAGAPDKPKVSVRPENFAVGDPLEILCITTGPYKDGVYEYTWYKGTRELTVKLHRIAYVELTAGNSGEYSCEVTKDGKTSLRSDPFIVSPKDVPTDLGRTFVQVFGGKTKKITITVIFHAPSKPNLTVGSYTYGSSLTLRCNKARPEDHSRLTYTFYVDGEVVKETWKDNMVINKFTNQFAGVYSCDVTADGARSVMSDPAVVAELGRGPEDNTSADSKEP